MPQHDVFLSLNLLAHLPMWPFQHCAVYQNKAHVQIGLYCVGFIKKKIKFVSENIIAYGFNHEIVENIDNFAR